MSPFVSIKVRNPEFEYLRIQCDIKFADRGNEGYDIAKLKKEIANFICPWFIDQSNALEFNKEIHVDALKDFKVTRFCHFYYAFFYHSDYRGWISVSYD